MILLIMKVEDSTQTSVPVPHRYEARVIAACSNQRGLGPVPYLSRATRTAFTFGRSFHLDVVYTWT